MNHAITINIDTDNLGHYTDSYLATLWHVAQANPVDHTDKDAGHIAESIGREIITRFLRNVPPELYAHQGNAHYWAALTKHCVWNGVEWVPHAAAPIDTSAPTLAATPPRIGADWSEQGGLYAGIVRGEDGAADHHLILLPGDAEDLAWQPAMDWAKAAGGELPTRREQSLLYANLKDQFKPNWYWSGAQHASASDCAWCQGFTGGSQSHGLTTSELRARAVRRLVIQ